MNSQEVSTSVENCKRIVPFLIFLFITLFVFDDFVLKQIGDAHVDLEKLNDGSLEKLNEHRKKQAFSPVFWAETTTPCNFICVEIDAGAGLGHRLANAAQGALLSRASGFPRASVSFEVGNGKHGNYPGADSIFSVSVVESRGVDCSGTKSGLSVSLLDRPPSEVHNNFSALRQWVLNSALSQKCGLLIVKDFWPRSYEPVWSEIEQLFHPFSDLGMELRTQVLYSQDVLNIAVHVRTGDNEPTPLSYFAPCLLNVLKVLFLNPLGKKFTVDVWLFSEAKLPQLESQFVSVASMFSRVNIRFEARESIPLLTFMYLTEADIFITSYSGFSWNAAIMSTKLLAVIAPVGDLFDSLLRKNKGERKQFIVADVNGSFTSDASALNNVPALVFQATNLAGIQRNAHVPTFKVA